MSGRHAIRLVAEREIRERLRSRVFLVSTLIMLLLVGGSTALKGALSKEPTFRFAVTSPAPPGLAAALRRAVDAVRRERPASSRRVACRRAPCTRREAGRRASAPALRPAGLQGERRCQDRRGRGYRGACAPPTAAAGAGAGDGDPPPSRGDANGRRGPGRDGRLPAPLHLPCRLRPVGGRRRRRGEEQPGRRADPRHDAFPPPARRQGDRDRSRRAGSARADRRARCPSARRRRLRCARRARLEPGALVIPWFALGFALYAVAYAAAAALASRQQSAETAAQPVTYTLVAVYFAGYVALSANANGIVANLLTVFPLSAPLVLPARSALVGVPAREHALALVLVLATIYALVRFAGRVYGHGLLHGGPRLGLRAAWRVSRES